MGGFMFYEFRLIIFRIFIACMVLLNSTDTFAHPVAIGEIFRLTVEGRWPNQFDVNPTETKIAAVFQGKIFEWSLQTRELISSHEVSKDDFIYQAHFTADNTLLVKGRDAIYGYDLSRSAVIWRIEYAGFHAKPIKGFSLEFDRFLTWNSNPEGATINIYRSSDGLLINKVSNRELLLADKMVFTSENEVLTWSYDKKIRRWNISSGELVFESDFSDFKQASDAKFYSSLGLAVTVSSKLDYPAFAVVWDLTSMKPTMIKTAGTELGRISGIYSVGLTSDGSRLLAGSDEGKLRVWDIKSGEEVARFEDPNFKDWIVRDLRVLSDNRHVLSITGSNLVMWELK